ncbi:MAG TPA: hypothetical protein DCF33_21390 [Saprospirales bacterium]|nr:hypothetical protein [Saprospirales bacterium]
MISVKAKDQSSKEFIVEIQVADALGFSKRVLFYTSQGYVSQKKIQGIRSPLVGL